MIYKSKYLMINWYYFIFILSLWQKLVCDSMVFVNWKFWKEIFSIKLVYYIFGYFVCDIIYFYLFF